MNADGSDQTRLTENDVDDQYPGLVAERRPHSLLLKISR